MFRILILLFAGIGLGYILRRRPICHKTETGVQVTIAALLFVFGCSIGSNRQLIGGLGQYGAADRRSGYRRQPAGRLGRTTLHFPERRSLMKSNLLIFGCFAAGILLGLSGLEPQWLHHPDLSVLLLSALILQVGIGLGASDNLKQVIRSLRPRMLLLPICTIVGSLLFAALATLLPGGRSLTECLAVGSGFGYYSLSSVLIANIGVQSLGADGAAELATVALLANVAREMCVLFCLPLFARWCGRIAPISAAGINSMDVCLPAIVRYSGGSAQLVPLAILHGIALEISVPMLITFFCQA